MHCRSLNGGPLTRSHSQVPGIPFYFVAAAFRGFRPTCLAGIPGCGGEHALCPVLPLPSLEESGDVCGNCPEGLALLDAQQ